MEDPKSALLEIRDVLWPAGDPDTVWSSDTIEEIAYIVDDAGYGPERNARQVKRRARRRQAGWMDTITGLLGKFTGGGDDKKQPPPTSTPADPAHAAHAGPPPSAPPQQHRPVAAPTLAPAAPVAAPPSEPLYWPPRQTQRNAIGPSWTMPYDPSREELCRSPSWCSDLESARAEWAARQRNG